MTLFLLACFGRSDVSFLFCVFTASIFLKKSFKVPFVSLLCYEIPLQVIMKSTPEKRDWNMEQMTNGS